MFELPSGAEIQSIIATLTANLGSFVPEIYLSVLFMLLIVIDLVAKGKKNNLLSITTLLGLAGSIFFIYQQHFLPAGELFFGMYVLDEFALFFKYFFVLSGMLAVVITMADEQFETEVKSMGEYYALIIAMVIGMIMMASSADLMMIFLSMELVSFSAFILTGYFKRNPRSSEAALRSAPSYPPGGRWSSGSPWHRQSHCHPRVRPSGPRKRC